MRAVQCRVPWQPFASNATARQQFGNGPREGAGGCHVPLPPALGTCQRVAPAGGQLLPERHRAPELSPRVALHGGSRQSRRGGGDAGGGRHDGGPGRERGHHRREREGCAPRLPDPGPASPNPPRAAPIGTPSPPPFPPPGMPCVNPEGEGFRFGGEGEGSCGAGGAGGLGWGGRS